MSEMLNQNSQLGRSYSRVSSPDISELASPLLSALNPPGGGTRLQNSERPPHLVQTQACTYIWTVSDGFPASTHIFHVVLDPVLLEVRRRLGSVEPLRGVHVGLLKVVPVDLQLVFGVGAQVH